MLLQLRMASQAAVRLFETHTGVTRPQFHTLVAIEKAQRTERSGPSQSVIVEATGIDRSTMADVVARLLTRSLISRHRNKRDLRAFELRLTPAGRKELARIKGAAREVEDRLHRATTLPEVVLSSLEAIAVIGDDAVAGKAAA